MNKHPKPGSDKPHPHPNQNSGQEQQRKISGDIHVRGEIEANVPESFIEKYKAVRNEQTPRDNARFVVECATLGLVFIYAGLTAIQSCQSLKSANAAESAAKTASRELELSQRPWVDADTQIGGPLFYNVNGANFMFTFTLRNSGRLPALNTFIEPKMAVIFNDEDPTQIRNELCADAKKTVKTSAIGVTLFPNVKYPKQETVTVNKQQMVSKRKESSGLIEGPVLAVCIAYSSTLNPTSIYTTSYIFHNHPGSE
jgi:hypothetical protein